MALRAKGKSQAECAVALGVSVRTIGRIVARLKAGPAAASSQSSPRRIASPLDLPVVRLLPDIESKRGLGLGNVAATNSWKNVAKRANSGLGRTRSRSHGSWA
jgi:transcriptional regulator with XRE-family HTH domain